MDNEKKIEPSVAIPEPTATEATQATSHAADKAAAEADKPQAPEIKPEAAPAIAVADADPAAEAPKAAAGRTPWKSNRFALLAATIAVAAGLGSIAGAAGYSGMAQLMTSPQVKPAPEIVRVDNSAEIKSLRETTAHLRASFKQLNDNVTAMRASLEGSGKGAGPQFAKINESISRLSDAMERSHTETSQRIAKTVDALDKLEKRANTLMAGADVTGSVPTPAPKGRSADARPGRPPAPPVVDGWNVRRVVDGLAILEGPDRVIEVEPGDTIRGIGRVHDIKRKDGRWTVLTASGIIQSTR